VSEPEAQAPVTIVVQTRAREGQDDAFGRWQATISAAVAEQPGFIEQSVMPPNPPAQTDWVILQRFTSADTAVAWLRSDRRQSLLREVQHLLIGVDDVHLLRDASTGAIPAPVTAVITTRVKPGHEEAFRAWEQRIAVAQARSPGFQGYRFEPPIPGVQDDWVAILRFDSEVNLQVWMHSPERQALLRESEPFIEEFRARMVRSGFDHWFTSGSEAAAGPPFPSPPSTCHSLFTPFSFGSLGLRQILDSAGFRWFNICAERPFAEAQARVASAMGGGSRTSV